MPKRTKEEEEITFKVGVKLPSEEDQLKGIGHDPVPAELLPLECFDPIPKPTHIDDWLAQYSVPRQSFNQWLKSETRVQPNDEENTIYLVTFGEFSNESLSDMKKYCEAFFCGLQVKILENIPLVSKGSKVFVEVTGQINRSRKVVTKSFDLQVRKAHPYDLHKVEDDDRQLCVVPLLHALRLMAPNDTCAIIGVTMEDLYEGATDSFVVGMAHGNSKEGFFSFKRYHPAFSSNKKKLTESDEKLFLKRCCKVLIHETMHLLGINHCVWFSCCMQGSGHLQEDFAQPLHLCPVDTAKLQNALKFDIMDQHQKLLSFYTDYNWAEERAWMAKRLKAIEEHKANNNNNNHNNKEEHRRSKRTKTKM